MEQYELENNFPNSTNEEEQDEKEKESLFEEIIKKKLKVKDEIEKIEKEDIEYIPSKLASTSNKISFIEKEK